MARDQQGLALAGAPESAEAFDRAMADYYGLTGDPVGVLKSALARDPGFALGGVAIAARGDVSVIPQACRMVTPYDCWYSFIIPSGTAEPPQHTVRSDEMSRPGLARRKCSTSFQIVGTAAATVGRSCSIMSTSGAA